MPIGVKTLANLRDRLELMMSIPSGNAYVDSTPELDDINEAYQVTADAYDWPSLLTRAGIAKVANLDRYALPSNFRKARTVRLDGVKLEKTELEFLRRSRRAYAIDQTQDDIIIKPIPSAASTAYTLSNAETAANAVTIELSSVSGLTALEEIWVDAASLVDEFTMVSSIDSSATAITARLDSNKSASDVIYRVNDILDILYYRRVTLLSGSSDVTLLPASIDFIMLMKAASLAYARLEMFDESERWEKKWKEDLAQAWLASDRGSTGEATHFSV